MLLKGGSLLQVRLSPDSGLSIPTGYLQLPESFCQPTLACRGTHLADTDLQQAYKRSRDFQKVDMTSHLSHLKLVRLQLSL